METWGKGQLKRSILQIRDGSNFVNASGFSSAMVDAMIGIAGVLQCHLTSAISATKESEGEGTADTVRRFNGELVEFGLDGVEC